MKSYKICQGFYIVFIIIFYFFLAFLYPSSIIKLVVLKGNLIVHNSAGVVQKDLRTPEIERNERITLHSAKRKKSSAAMKENS